MLFTPIWAWRARDLAMTDDRQSGLAIVVGQVIHARHASHVRILNGSVCGRFCSLGAYI